MQFTVVSLFFLLPVSAMCSGENNFDRKDAARRQKKEMQQQIIKIQQQATSFTFPSAMDRVTAAENRGFRGIMAYWQHLSYGEQIKLRANADVIFKAYCGNIADIKKIYVSNINESVLVLLVNKNIGAASICKTIEKVGFSFTEDEDKDACCCTVL
jgi:hypothetical protein